MENNKLELRMYGLVPYNISQSWVKFVGGEKNVFLRDFLKKFKLA